MTKQEFIRANQVSQMPRLVQVLIGRLYDAAFEDGRKVGFRQGVDEVAKKEQQIYRMKYEEGVTDANRRGSAAFTVAACRTLHRAPYRFGKDRMQRVVDGIAEELIGMLDPAEAVREVRSWGVRIEWDDELEGEL